VLFMRYLLAKSKSHGPGRERVAPGRKSDVPGASRPDATGD